MDASNISAQRLKPLFNTLVAPINVIDSINYGFSMSDQTGNDQTSRRPQITGHDRSALELALPLNDRGITLNLDIRTHANHLMRLH